MRSWKTIMIGDRASRIVYIVDAVAIFALINFGIAAAGVLGFFTAILAALWTKLAASVYAERSMYRTYNGEVVVSKVSKERLDALRKAMER